MQLSEYFTAIFQSSVVECLTIVPSFQLTKLVGTNFPSTALINIPLTQQSFSFLLTCSFSHHLIVHYTHIFGHPLVTVYKCCASDSSRFVLMLIYSFDLSTVPCSLLYQKYWLIMLALFSFLFRLLNATEAMYLDVVVHQNNLLSSFQLHLDNWYLTTAIVLPMYHH